jgi:hypothetical protein
MEKGGAGGQPGTGGGVGTGGGSGGRGGSGGSSKVDAATDGHQCIITDVECTYGTVRDAYGCPVCAPPPSSDGGANDAVGKDGAGEGKGRPDAGADVADGAGADRAQVDTALDSPQQSDGQADAKGLVLPCPADASVPIWNDKYACGRCESDMGYALACVDGQLACATSYVGTSGNVIQVPPGNYVVAKQDVMTWTGQCAYLATYDDPGFILFDPPAIITDRDPTLPLVLQAVSSSPARNRATFGSIFADRAKGESAIRSLVTLTDMTNNSSVAYTIGTPIEDPGTEVESLTLQPSPPLTANTWYRVTVYPAETQHLVSCHTFSRTWAWLQAPETSDFYTYSRPMVFGMSITPKSDTKGYVQIDFSEWLSGSDLSAHPAATIAVDGVELSGCISPYPCSGSTPAKVGWLRLDLQVIPTVFTEMVLRIPHAIKAIKGGTLLDGTVGNPYVKVDGDWAVYTFKAADMVLTDDGLVRRWYYVGK